eukprot:gb/GECG01015669.1/.p1 GENE.gb/GECG01015669.1/~~gb/GECG01015669.1/.p1  ORF type:complete len:337 (+),score=34.08 gb/GECG01015669.1/:1-1011(+)
MLQQILYGSFWIRLGYRLSSVNVLVRAPSSHLLHRQVRESHSKIMRKFAVINCEDAPKWDGAENLLIEPFRDGVFNGYKFMDDDFIATGEKESWETFCVAAGDKLPSLDEAKNYDGFVLTGSHYSATQDDEWILTLARWLKDITQISQQSNVKRPRILAICFGAQITARALGGEAAKNPSGRMVTKAEKIFPTEAFFQMSYARDILKRDEERGVKVCPSGKATFSKTGTVIPEADCSTKGFFRILESHGDCVNALPPQAELLAYSDSAKCEIFRWKDSVLACQSHPEFTDDVMREKIYPDERGWLDQQETEEYHASLQLERHNLPLLKIMWRFLKG